MSKHQEILAYLEELPVGKRVSVRSWPSVKLWINGFILFSYLCQS